MKMIKLFAIPIMIIVAVLDSAPVNAFDFQPPQNIVSKEPFPLKEINMVRTQKGNTYLISKDGRYVFQGALVDVWNGVAVKDAAHLNRLSDKVNFKYLGITAQKMFTLDIGIGTEEVFIFSDPNCGVCHQLIKEISNSGMIKKNFKIHVAVTPMLRPTSMEKSIKLSKMARKDPQQALNTFINNTYSKSGSAEKTDATPPPGIKYNLLIARALSIRNFPYIVNASGRTHIGMPDDIRLFLLKK